MRKYWMGRKEGQFMEEEKNYHNEETATGKIRQWSGVDSTLKKEITSNNNKTLENWKG